MAPSNETVGQNHSGVSGTHNQSKASVEKAPVYTTSNGCPIFNPVASQRAGENGPLLLQDFHLIDLLANFDRERIPERVVHAKGAGAHGYFEVTHDITDITSANFLNKVGKKTPVVARFSTVGGEKGSADSARDPRGFSIKMFTQEGNLDWVYNNTPVFFLREAAKFPLFIHTQKRNPQTNLKDPNAFWDYFATNPEAMHQVMVLFSDRGTPYSYRHMNGYSGHTYKFSKPDGSFKYVQIHLKTDQGIKNFTDAEAGKLAGENPDWHTQDLFDAIEKGENPSWTAYAQVMDPADAEKYRWNIFDLTKVWPHKDYPLIPFGKLVLNKNPENYFAEIEQVAFSPSHVVPGWEPTNDPVLQSRLFSYPDTHRHRLGVNYQQIPVNCPLHTFNFQRDGNMSVRGNYGSNPNYIASDRPVRYMKSNGTEEHEKWTGSTVNKLQPIVPDDFVQPAGLWKVFGKEEGQQENFVQNVAGHLGNAKEDVRKRMYEVFAIIDKDLAQRLETAIEKKE